ncbi:hypothetical protein FHL15_002419 [Xylaria flabelliformis]|uniref:Uncharacterized protein n=1 Tax=Xylaria flabelliformis TaxID=2512241 RepID=A0A553I971_9PEZI|nr:hypothetical protein FHL15_002419 [Xylaria flabelliformis]
MGNLYWDPSNLLQIASDEDEHANIQCVGKSQRAFGSRCSWPILDSERATARRLLLELASMMPSEVSASKLDQLAAVCLCQYHPHLRQETIERWFAVVKRAAKQYEYLQRSAVEEQDKKLIADLSALITGGKSTLEESSQVIQMVKDTVSDLEREKALLQRRLQTSGNVAKVLRCVGDFWESRVAFLRRENYGFGEKVRALFRENETLRTTNNLIDHQLRSASTKMVDLNDEIRRLGGEFKLQGQSLRQSYVKLQRERDRGITLQNKVTTMEQRILVLEKDMSMCWLHGFCAWINRQLQMLAAFAVFRASRR